jgi:hypothetical protein
MEPEDSYRTRLYNEIRLIQMQIGPRDREEFERQRFYSGAFAALFQFRALLQSAHAQWQAGRAADRSKLIVLPNGHHRS